MKEIQRGKSILFELAGAQVSGRFELAGSRVSGCSSLQGIELAGIESTVIPNKPFGKNANTSYQSVKNKLCEVRVRSRIKFYR